jgi:hypothetical protein
VGTSHGRIVAHMFRYTDYTALGRTLQRLKSPRNPPYLLLFKRRGLRRVPIYQCRSARASQRARGRLL